MNKLDKQYTDLLQDILDNGVKKTDRTGTGTLSVFSREIRHKMSDGFPLLTTKKMYFKGVITELLWFLQGRTDLRYLLENDCNIWTGDAFKNYCTTKETITENADGTTTLSRYSTAGHYGAVTKEEFVERIKTDDEFSKKWGDLGPIYGAQWRSWTKNDCSYPKCICEDSEIQYCQNKHENIDQIANLINDLKTNPDSRRLMVNAWNVSELDEMTLPPCHYGFQCYTRELTWEEQVQWVMRNTDVELENLYIVEEIAKDTTPKRAISLKWNQRSIDTPLGLPFNIASYGLLLEILAKEVNMVPDELIGSLGDCHIYLNQIDGVKEQIGREGYALPRLKHMKTDAFYKSLSEDQSLYGHLDNTDFQIENYQSHPSIKFPLSN